MCWLGHAQADVRALRLERRQVAQERKLDALHRAALGRQLEQAKQDQDALQKEHGRVVTGLQEELTYNQHARGAFQAQVGSFAFLNQLSSVYRRCAVVCVYLIVEVPARKDVVHIWGQEGPAMDC